MSEGLIILYVLIFWTVVLTAFVLVSRFFGRQPTAHDIALEELRASYARAEMSYQEYERRKQELSNQSSSRPLDAAGPPVAGQ
jgi:hypothetical protein